MFDIKPYTDRFQATISHFEEELKKVRTGRAHPDMLDSVMVEVYGTKMPLAQAASVSVPEPQQLLVTPFDPANLQVIAAAIRNDQTLGLNPSDDGRNVRIMLPPLNEERRREIVRNLGDKTENARIGLRNVREEARKAARIQKEAKVFGEDELKRIDRQIDDEIAKYNSQIDELLGSKETEIMTI